MDGHRLFSPKVKRYRERLSPFGGSVLEMMMKKWAQDRESRQRTQRNDFYDAEQPIQPRLPKEKIVLSFKGAEVPRSYCNSFLTSSSYHTPQVLTFREDENNLMNSPDEVPTSMNIVTVAVDVTNEAINDFDSIKNKNILNDPSNNIVKAAVYDFCTQYSDDDDKRVKTHIDLLKTEENKNNAKISWDNMFDSEFLAEMLPSKVIKASTVMFMNQESENIMSKPRECVNQSTKVRSIGKVAKRKDIKIISDQILTKEMIKKARKNLTNTDLKKNKSETKKPVEISFRKTKYTKYVKNWLETVDPSMPILDKVVENSEEQPIVGPTKINSETNETEHAKAKANLTSTEKTLKTINKKSVQTKLANKDGIMKFRKPKNGIEENEKSKDSALVKKTKPKFIAPIKSQLSVKELSYNVVKLTNDNVENILRSSFNGSNSKTMAAVLIYRNGFNQLNCHHTDDYCKLEGVMMNVKDEFLYLKTSCLDLLTMRDLLEDFVTNKNIVCYEAKKIISYFAIHLNIDIHKCQLKMLDAKIGASLIDSDSSLENFSDLQKAVFFSPDYTIATECNLQKAAWYITLLQECMDRLKSLLIEQDLWNVFDDIEMNLVPIIAEMELRGIRVDLKKLKSMETTLQTKLKSAELACHKAAGRVFPINSTVQVRSILYEELKLDSMSNVKIRETICTGEKSTSESELRSLGALHPLPKLILEYRHLHKAHATFLAGVAHHVRDGYVRPTWVQTAAVTGRIASNNPNLQAIPKAPFSLVLFPEVDDTESPTLNFRSVYVARPGYKLLAADFQHIECRVFAHAAADTGLLDILQSQGDLFRVLASKWLNKAESEVSAEDRDRTKRIVYASLYGAGVKKLMDILDASYDRTMAIMSSFNRTFPSLKRFGRGVVSRCEAGGGRLATLCGRVRRFTNIASKDFGLKSHAERQAVNFVVQGSAADLCKMAMVLTEDRLRSHCPPVQGHLVLQIHDELVWEIRDEDLFTAAEIVKEVMENCGHKCGLSLKLPVAVSSGQNWGEMREFAV